MLTKPPPKLTGTIRPAEKSGHSFVSFDRRFGYDLPIGKSGRPAWVEVLEECGYPTTCIVLDFETYFDKTYQMGGAKGLSMPEYLDDPRFEILGLAYCHGGDCYQDNTEFEIGDVSRCIDWFKEQYGEQLEGCTVIFQNAKFDASILARKFGVHPRYVVDTLALARHLNSRQKHGLAELCKRWGLKDKGDTSEFAGVSLRDREVATRKQSHVQPPADSHTLQRLSDYAINDALREWELFTILLPRISTPRTELTLQKHTLELFTKPSLKVDYDKAETLKVAIGAEIDRCLESAGQTREAISGNISFTELLVGALRESGDDLQKYFKQGKKGPLLAIAKSDNFGDELDNHRSASVRSLMAARRGIKSWPLHLKRIDGIVQQAKASEGFLPVDLRYYGAHTGRWSGGGGINLQNLGSKSHELVNAIRHVIVPAEGESLVIVDLGAIEARVLAWVAGQDDLVEKFRKNADVYSEFASIVLGYRVVKANPKLHPPLIAKRMGWARNSVGKIGVLGCGYGMGATKAVSYAQGAIDFATSENIVRTYRATNSRIVAFWYDVGRAFLHSAKYGRPCQMPRGLHFDSSKENSVILGLPNGRKLLYPHVKVTHEDGNDKLSVWNDLLHKDEHLWGGTITENIVQAISRDILAEAMLRLELKARHTALHLHDELVLVAKKEDAEACLADTIEEMTREPAWAPGLPLAAEGKIAERYEK